MIYLSGVVRSDLPPAFGFMLQPGMGNRPPAGAVWAADNGCFSTGDRFDAGRWLDWLDGFDAVERGCCLFAVAPDVVGNAKATWERSRSWLREISDCGFVPALVAQEGFDGHVDWDAFGCLFIGGRTTEWKLSPAAQRAAQQARARGKWVHMGRVNSLRRIQAAVLMGCDSADGTYLRYRLRKKGPGASAAIAEMSGWLNRLEAEPFLPLLEAIG